MLNEPLRLLGLLPDLYLTALFAANIFLLGLSNSEADASQVLLQECVSYIERVVLHEIGLSIGNIDWIKDYHFFSLYAEHSNMSKECHASKSIVSQQWSV